MCITLGYIYTDDIFKIFCDNTNVVNNLKKKHQELSARLARYFDYVVLQSATIEYMKTTENLVADYISRNGDIVVLAFGTDINTLRCKINTPQILPTHLKEGNNLTTSKI